VRHPPKVPADRTGPVGRQDVPLVAPPDLAAAALCDLVATAGARPLALHTSPLARCAAPARLAAARLDLPLLEDARLLEIDMGRWTGRAWTDIEREEPAAVAAWMEHWEHAGPPAGESAADVAARVRAWLTTLAPGTHVVITHAGVVRALRVVCEGVAWPDAMRAPVPHLGEPDALHTFRYDR
jgi:alpha-ribazole phosphatase